MPGGATAKPSAVAEPASNSGSTAAPSATSSSKHFLIATISQQSPTIISSNGLVVTDAFTDVFEDADGTLDCVEWLTSSIVDNQIAFSSQGNGIGYLDLVKKSIDVPSGSATHMGDEYGGVCQDGLGRFWVTVSGYGQTSGVVVDADGAFCGVGFGHRPNSDDKESRSDDDDDDHAPLAMASLHPFSDEVVVASRESLLRVYRPDGTESRVIQLQPTFKAIGVACVPSTGNATEPYVLAVIVECPLPPPATTSPPAASKRDRQHGQSKRFAKCIRAVDRDVVVLSGVTASTAAPPSVLKRYSAAHLSRNDSLPVTITSLPDGSAVVGMSDGVPLRLWPADAGTIVKPLVAPSSTGSQHVIGASQFAAVAVDESYLREVEQEVAGEA